VVAELAGEKIDVIPWNDNPAVFVANALSPAQVLDVSIDEEHRIASVTVPERMLSLAIGREGQNARLAAKLTGWRIDIRSDVSVAEAKAAAAAEAAIAAAEAPAAGVASGEEASVDVPTGAVADTEPARKVSRSRKTAEAEPASAGEAPPAVAPKSTAKPRASRRVADAAGTTEPVAVEAATPKPARAKASRSTEEVSS
jgi:N utilization substance protein A